MPSTAPRYTLTLACRGGTGQIARASTRLAKLGCYIDEMSVFDDTGNGRFFMRCVFHARHAVIDPSQLRHALVGSDADDGFDMHWQLFEPGIRPRVLIMVSRLDHCLNDLIYRQRIGDIDMEIAAIVSNHALLEPVATAAGLPFLHLPVEAGTRERQEERLLQLMQDSDSELLILARYMQVLSHPTSQALAGRAINIHHSFLPGFKGARPYHQAHARGVKLIGATAHYVTDDLDEGPIIEQVVERVDHAFTPERLQAAGRDMECQALARAVRYHLERRVFISGSRVVVLR
ncbi:formyltetrahydrofolate deformylase [Paludibacterium yongneupense]|uniref:formyltetrahydrofolate deformylase n=1 Tax=Paludibacterium yongneupense TaxID=400061 RepID=UPI00042A7CFF|nr:formyltetrahydrofolate deformylase [Paludibacterium yongneupense]